MFGASYLSFVQWDAASARPVALKAIAPALTSTDYYSVWYSPGGALCAGRAPVASGDGGRPHPIAGGPQRHRSTPGRCSRAASGRPDADHRQSDGRAAAADSSRSLVGGMDTASVQGRILARTGADLTAGPTLADHRGGTTRSSRRLYEPSNRPTLMHRTTSCRDIIWWSDPGITDSAVSSPAASSGGRPPPSHSSCPPCTSDSSTACSVDVRMPRRSPEFACS